MGYFYVKLKYFSYLKLKEKKGRKKRFLYIIEFYNIVIFVFQYELEEGERNFISNFFGLKIERCYFSKYFINVEVRVEVRNFIFVDLLGKQEIVQYARVRICYIL